MVPSKGHQHSFYSGHSLLRMWWQVLQEKWEHWVPGTLTACAGLLPLILGTGSLPLCFTPECAGFLDLGLPTLWRTGCQFQQMGLLKACQLARRKTVWAVAQQRWTGTVIPPQTETLECPRKLLINYFNGSVAKCKAAGNLETESGILELAVASW